MKIAEVAPVMRDFIKEYHVRGAEVILTELVYAMKETDPFYRGGSGLVQILVHAIRMAEEEGGTDGQ